MNDSPEQADALYSFVDELPVKINLIPFNVFPGASFEEPEEEVITTFIHRLREHGIYTLLRGRKGLNIHAACGQLQ